MKSNFIHDSVTDAIDQMIEKVANSAIKNKTVGTLFGFSVVVVSSAMLAITGPLTIIENLCMAVLNFIGSQFESNVKAKDKKFTLSDGKVALENALASLIFIPTGFVFMCIAIAGAIRDKKKAKSI